MSNHKIIEAYRVLNSLEPPLPFHGGIVHYGKFWYDIKTHPITNEEIREMLNEPIVKGRRYVILGKFK